MQNFTKIFTKICLTSAALLFVVGAMLSLVCGFLGGFGELRKLDDSGFLFPYIKASWPPLRFGFFSDESWNGDNWQKDGFTRLAPGEKVQVSDIRSLDISLGDCLLFLEEQEGDDIRLYAEGDGDCYWQAEGGNLRLSRKSRRIRIWEKYDVKERFYLYLPKGQRFDDIALSFGAGVVEGAVLRADHVDIDLGAGECKLQGIEGKSLSVDLGAGRVSATDVTVTEADLNVGAGRIEIPNLVSAGEVDLELGMGDALIGGDITGHLDVQCGMGNVAMKLAGSEDDHSYSVDCSMGSVRVGSRKAEGLASTQEWNAGKSSEFVIECSMGTVDISFGAGSDNT